MREGFRDVKNSLESNEQQCPPKLESDLPSKLTDSLSSMLDEVVNLTKEGFKDVKQIKEALKHVGDQQSSRPVDTSGLSEYLTCRFVHLMS